MIKSRIGLFILLMLSLGLTIHFLGRQNGKLAGINRIIPLKIPKHAQILDYHKSESILTAVIRIDTNAYSSFWEKYFADKRTVPDVDHATLLEITNTLKTNNPDRTRPYFSQYNCERGVLYKFSAAKHGALLYMKLLIPDWTSEPDCEKLFSNHG